MTADHFPALALQTLRKSGQSYTSFMYFMIEYMIIDGSENVDVLFSVNNIFLESPSLGKLKDKRFGSKII